MLPNVVTNASLAALDGTFKTVPLSTPASSGTCELNSSPLYLLCRSVVRLSLPLPHDVLFRIILITARREHILCLQEVRVIVGLTQLYIVVSMSGVTATRLFCALLYSSVQDSVEQDLHNNQTKSGYPEGFRTACHLVVLLS